MIIAGVNLPTTFLGKPLKDGGTCIVEDDKILVSLAEERVTRDKYAGGFNNSLACCLESCHLSVAAIDLLVASSCCETVRTVETIETIKGLSPKKIRFVNHHLSHAYSSFFTSPFSEALIIVADGGGNILEQNRAEWWKAKREQMSYFIGRGDQIQLIGRDFDGPHEAGLGEIYRYFTHHLGWRTADSGKVTALATQGDRSTFARLKLIDFDTSTGALHSPIHNDPLDMDTFSRYLSLAGFNRVPKRLPDHPLEQIHKDLAAYVQYEVCAAMLNKITYLVRTTGITNLCLAGGVALNCAINDQILRETPVRDIFIQPAAGDQGQPIGNAIYGAVESGVWKTNGIHYNNYLGPEHEWDLEVKSLDTVPNFPRGRPVTRQQLVSEVAKKLLDGRVIGWVQGKSEAGPRALGNRSILADPRSVSIRDRLNSIKKREDFMPIAPSVLDEDKTRYFQISTSSPYMLRAVPTTPAARMEIPAVVHFDGTSRIQTVTRFQNDLFYDLLSKFRELSGVPVLANTSLNDKGEPIVENANDAAKAFLNLNLDALVIGNWIFDLLANSQL